VCRETRTRCASACNQEVFLLVRVKDWRIVYCRIRGDIWWTVWKIHEIISDQGSMYLYLWLVYVSISVTSNVRWRNSFYYKTSTSGAETRTTGTSVAVLHWIYCGSDYGVFLSTRRKENTLREDDTITDANWDACTPLQRIASPRRWPVSSAVKWMGQKLTSRAY